MAFADPLSITYDGVTYSLPRTSSGTNQGSFSGVDATKKYDLEFQVSHQYGKSRARRMARFNVGTLNANPYLNTSTVWNSSSVYLVADIPNMSGIIIDPSTVQKQILALTGWLTANTNANSLALAQGQN